MILWNDDQRAYLIRTAAMLTPAEQASHLNIPIKIVQRQRHYLRKLGRLSDSAITRWTCEERERARVMVRDGKSPAQIGKVLGRSPNAVLEQLTVWGVNVRRELARSEGMDVREVAESLGVGRDIVIDWIRRGFLRASRRRVLRQTVYSVSYTAVLAFITERGGYTRLRPSPRFAGPVDEARRAFNLRYISRRDLASSLCISENTLGHWPTRFGFPSSHMFGRCSYFDRGEVRAFLVDHPALAPASFWREWRRG
jgi:hypothetical protein